MNIEKSFAEAVSLGGTKRKSASPLASRAKEPTIEEDIPDSVRDELSAQLEQIRSLNSSSYIPNSINPTSKPTYKATSEASFGNSWDRGLTDLVQMEFLTLNGQSLNISLARPEILYVWSEIMNADQSIIFGISFKKPMNRGLIASIKLKKQVQIDDLFAKPDFSYNRGNIKTDGSYDIVTGRILGLRAPPPPRANNEEVQRPGYTRINVYGLAFDIDKAGVEKWLEKFGDVLGFDDIMDRELPELATGDVSVKMKIKKDIPCFLPMYGKKIRIAYRGMPTICSNCFDIGHIRRDCKNGRVAWIDYVKNLHSTGRFEDDLFGKWIGILKTSRQTQRPSRPIRPTLEEIPETPNEETDNVEIEKSKQPPEGEKRMGEVETDRDNTDNTDDESVTDSATDSNAEREEEKDDKQDKNSESRSIIGSIADFLLKK